MFTTRQLSDSPSRASHTLRRPAPPGTAWLAGRPLGRVGSLPRGHAHSIRPAEPVASLVLSSPQHAHQHAPPGDTTCSCPGWRPAIMPNQWTPSAEQLFVPSISWSSCAACLGFLHHPAVFHVFSRACPALYQSLHSSLQAMDSQPCHSIIVAFSCWQSGPVIASSESSLEGGASRILQLPISSNRFITSSVHQPVRIALHPSPLA